MKVRKMLKKIKYNKFKVLGIIALFLVSLMSVGFAYMSQKLEVKGLVNVFNGFSVRITDIVVNEMTSNGTTEYNPTYTKTIANITTNLPNIDSSVTYQIKFRNYSTDMIAELESIIEESISSDIITYELSIKEKDLIDADSSIIANLKIKYKDNINTVPEDCNFGLGIKFNFIIHEEEIDVNYNNNGLILNLKGTDEAVNNVWYDSTNGLAMKLNKVTYDKENKKYDFNSESYATLDRPLIPETGDFTLEAYIESPSDSSLSSDEAIVAQVSDTANDTGRFKLNLNDKVLRVFYNRQYPNNTNIMTSFTDLTVADQKYLMQVVRSGDTINLYLNGSLINSSSYLTSNKISQGPFKLGKWNKGAIQPFYGSYYSVRLYNRALTKEELDLNMESDNLLYSKRKKEYHTIKEYAVEEQISDIGGSLYIDNLGRYVYRGDNPNNYIKIPGSDDLYRILFYDEDSTMKVVNVTSKYNEAFDISGNRNSNDSTYCVNSSTIADKSNNLYYGCNAWEINQNFNNISTSGTVQNNSSSNEFLNNDYYNNLSEETKNKIINHNFYIGIGKENLGRDSINTESITKKWKGNIGLLTLSDVLNSSINSVVVKSGSASINSYLTSNINSNDIYWTMTATNTNTYDTYTILTNLIGKRRASRTFQKDGSKNYKTYLLPSFYISNNVPFTGTGTEVDPFIIK